MTTSTSTKINCINTTAGLASLGHGEVAYDTATGNIYVGDSSTSSSICIGNSNYNTYNSAYGYNNGYVTTATSDVSWYRQEYDMRDLLLCLKEDELLEIMRKAKERLEEKQFKKQLKMVVYEYHLSESFLLEFIDFLDKSDVMRLHKRDIISGEYETLKCLYELQ